MVMIEGKRRAGDKGCFWPFLRKRFASCGLTHRT